MVSRFKRRAAPPEVTFFVFQDILTSMIGVMIMVTLTLGLQIDDSALNGGDQGKVDPKLSENLDRVLAEIAALRPKIAAMGKNAGYTPSAEATETELSRLRDQIATFEKSNEARQERLQKFAMNPANAILSGEIKDAGAKTAGLTSERERLKTQVDENNDRLAKATRAVDSAESKLKEEGTRREVLRLIPEMSGTNKQPVLLTASGAGFKMIRYDNSAVVAEGSFRDLPQGLKKLKASDEYVVLFIRPSAARQFGDYLKTVKDAGFEVGYDLIGEDVKFEFSKG